jgi:TRAP-type C4-dicarboxylate transport system permease small subunit
MKLTQAVIVGNKKLRFYVVVIVCLILAGFIAINVFAYQHAHAMLYFSEDETPALKLDELITGQKD